MKTATILTLATLALYVLADKGGSAAEQILLPSYKQWAFAYGDGVLPPSDTMNIFERMTLVSRPIQHGGGKCDGGRCIRNFDGKDCGSCSGGRGEECTCS
ncbi:hypothetical protein B0H16DRAFT_1548094 [Mycena metata]|uniref:Uncharacterized protein n=1 Tax=Mycena metata TaxID=1033252 RepID=A0AAD7IY23_9AGAR|nr:hypothetical protein B0H16DRAFT_1548094 [Mycena metata]